MALPAQAEFLDAMTRILSDKRRWPNWALTEALISHFNLTKQDLTAKKPGTRSTLFNLMFCDAHFALFEQEALAPSCKNGGFSLDSNWVDAQKTQSVLVVPESNWRIKREAIKAELEKATSHMFFHLETENLVRSTLIHNGEGELQEKIISTPLNMCFSLFCWGCLLTFQEERVHICFYTPLTSRLWKSPPSVVRKFVEESRMLNSTRNILFSPFKFTPEEKDYLLSSGLDIRAFDVDDIVNALVEDDRALVYNQVEGTFSLNPDFLPLPRN